MPFRLYHCLKPYCRARHHLDVYWDLAAKIYKADPSLVPMMANELHALAAAQSRGVPHTATPIAAFVVLPYGAPSQEYTTHRVGSSKQAYEAFGFPARRHGHGMILFRCAALHAAGHLPVRAVQSISKRLAGSAVTSTAEAAVRRAACCVSWPGLVWGCVHLHRKGELRVRFKPPAKQCIPCSG